MEAPLRIEVDAAAEGERLDQLLVAATAIGSRTQAQRLIDAGLVTVDGELRPKRHRVAAGELVEVAPEPAAQGVAAAVEDVPFTVLWEDEHLLVVDKPAGIVVHPARGHRGSDARGGARRPCRRRGGPGTRRDRPPARQGHLRPARRREVGDGPPRAAGGDPQTQSCDASTSRSSRAARRRAAARSTRRSAATGACARACRPTPTSRARRAHTSSWSARCPATRCCASRWRPAARTRSASTCRRSAIRSRATPTTGSPAQLGLQRQFLHAARLAFAHPVTSEPIDVSSPLPPDLAAVLARLEAEAAGGGVQ